MFFNKHIAAVAFASLLQLTSAQRTVQEQSALTNPADQCKYYDYPPVSTQIANFPAIWKTATILPSDSAARAKFNEISAGIPKLPLKGLKAKETYDKTDPDCWWTATECKKPKHEGIPEDVSIVPEPNTLGYGFDDGPNCSHNAFYDYLTQQNQKATMFFIGSNVIGWPLQAKRAFEDGHELCVHTWSHQELTGMSDEEVFAEIWYIARYSTFLLAVQAIKLVTGATTTCFRAPFGDIDDRVRYIGHHIGVRHVIWNHDTFDTIPDKTTGKVEVANVRKNYEAFLATANSGAFARVTSHRSSALQEGAILLAHETNNMTMQEAVSYYPQLKAAFKHIVPVGVALNITQPYVETTFSQPSFEQYIAGTVQTKGPATNPQSGLPSNSASSNGSSSGNRTTSNLGNNGALPASSVLSISTLMRGLGFTLLVSAMV
ncbi:glycoside hydrolase/deacetylase [Marasmius fiardii PR-910]|nr:glycoside hydrolase/deacetylase [Marasmius fiardii PR-910]